MKFYFTFWISSFVSQIVIFVASLNFTIEWSSVSDLTTVLSKKNYYGNELSLHAKLGDFWEGDSSDERILTKLTKAIEQCHEKLPKLSSFLIGNSTRARKNWRNVLWSAGCIRPVAGSSRSCAWVPTNTPKCHCDCVFINFFARFNG